MSGAVKLRTFIWESANEYVPFESVGRIDWDPMDRVINGAIEILIDGKSVIPASNHAQLDYGWGGLCRLVETLLQSRPCDIWIGSYRLNAAPTDGMVKLTAVDLDTDKVAYSGLVATKALLTEIVTSGRAFFTRLREVESAGPFPDFSAQGLAAFEELDPLVRSLPG